MNSNPKKEKEKIDIDCLPESLDDLKLTRSEENWIKKTADSYIEYMTDRFFDTIEYGPIEERFPSDYYEEGFPEEIYEKIEDLLVAKYFGAMAESLMGGIDGLFQYVMKKCHKKYKIVFVGNNRIFIVQNPAKVDELIKELNGGSKE